MAPPAAPLDEARARPRLRVALSRGSSAVHVEPTESSRRAVLRVRPRQRCPACRCCFLHKAVKESHYSLHVICGVNEHVSGPKFGSTFMAHYPFKYQCSHINFLATQDAQPPKLFFAECNLEDYKDTWCLPVDWSRPVGGQARCFYCESHGNRIIHPASSVFRGFDFEEAFFGPDTKHYYDNDQIIFFKRSISDWVYGVEEEAIYDDYRLRDDDGNGDSKRLCFDEASPNGTPWRPAPPPGW